MLVKEVIEQLKDMPQDAIFTFLYDGGCCPQNNMIYLSKDGRVIISSFEEVIYRDKDRPIESPSVEEETYWYLPENPNETEEEDI